MHVSWPSTPTPVGTCGTPSAPAARRLPPWERRRRVLRTRQEQLQLCQLLPRASGVATEVASGHRHAAPPTNRSQPTTTSASHTASMVTRRGSVLTRTTASFRETSRLGDNNGGGHLPSRPPRPPSGLHRHIIKAVVSCGHRLSLFYHPSSVYSSSFWTSHCGS